MDAESKSAAALFRAIAAVGEELVGMARDVRTRPEVARAVHGLTFRDYRVSGPTLEGYVDAELRDGAAVAWLFDATQDGDRWVIGSSVVVGGERDDGGQVTVKHYPDKLADTVDDFIAQLRQTTTELAASVTSLDLTNLPVERLASVDTAGASTTAPAGALPDARGDGVPS